MERLLRRWEGLRSGVQAAIAIPLAVAFMFLLHVGPFNQPLGRAVSYACFWGILLGGAAVAATRSEAAKRRARDRDRSDKEAGL